MSLLLHLSDLHLGNTPSEDVLGDHKVEAIKETDRVKRVDLLRNTLIALAGRLRQDAEYLDAVVITGDVTTQGRPDGLSALTDMLGALGDRLPSKDRIVVVPGNHDVAWYTPSGSAERYRAFVEHIRDAGYRTPLLDGIDYDGEEAHAAAQPLLVGDDFVVAAVNSADASGLLEPLPPAVQSELDTLVATGAVTKELQDALRRIRTYDMSRVNGRQMAALGARLDAIGRDHVRIVALHHQLVPVTQEEEVKTFESMINLGAFLSFLGETEIDLVAHGHKHVEAILPLALTGPSARLRSAIVSSCGTVGGPIGVGKEVARLIRVHSELPTLRRIEILSLAAVGPGTARLTNPKLKTVYEAATWRDTTDTDSAIIGGATATDVHEQLLDLGRPAGGRTLRDVMCFVEQGPSALTPPASYPWTADPDALEPWFRDIVEWWQDPVRAPGKPFTHGQRLRDWAGDGRNQLDAMIEILSSKSSTSRAVAVLFDPNVDKVEDKSLDFPSFSLLHLWIADRRVHCTAFFRKQEMRYWWAINAAELAGLQQHVTQRLRQSDDSLSPGSIRTYASEAVFSDRLPKVNVPEIDRLSWSAPHELQVLAVAVADTDMAGREEVLTHVVSMLKDWKPSDPEPPVDGAPVPAHGLPLLTTTVSALASHYPDSPAREAAELLQDIVQSNELYGRASELSDSQEAYKQWRRRVLPKLDRLEEILATSTGQ